MPLKKLKPKPSDSRDKWIAHFGGSFNPVHNGHLATAGTLLEQYGFDRVIFCPNGDHYPKPGLAPAQDRLALLEIAIAADPRFAVSKFELDKNYRVNTIETIRHIHENLGSEFTDFRLFSIRGADWLEAMQQWKSLPSLVELCDFVVIPREIKDLTGLSFGDLRFEENASSFFLMDTGEDVRAISSTRVRRSIYEKVMTGLPVPESVLVEIVQRGMYGVTAAGENWITLCRPGYSGKIKRDRDRERDELYGKGNWRTAFAWGGEVIRYKDALNLYEDAYLEHFRNRPAELDWLVATASEVYDNSETNVLSGLDYDIQEAASTHLQDIAVRRCLMRLGMTFKGNHLVEIRGHDSEGYRLNPGRIPFHRPGKIITPEQKKWWLPGSVESFWQSNKIFQVKEKAFHQGQKLFLHLVFMNEKDEILTAMDSGNVSGLPVIVFEQGEGFDSRVEEQLTPYEGAKVSEFKPVLVEPVCSGGNVHVIISVERILATAPPDHEYMPIDYLLSRHFSKQLKKLLKQFRKHHVNK